jgi:transcriptional regulator with XRE-family HTH domain
MVTNGKKWGFGPQVSQGEAMETISRQQAIALGQDRYFTGESCVNGHISQRWTKSKKCIECSKESNRKGIAKLLERGISRYVGRPCSNGHGNERYVANGVCVVCHRERVKGRRLAFRKANPLPPPRPKRFEDLAQEIRLQGMTLEQFSLKMGWKKQTISFWCSMVKGARNPWIDEFVAAWKCLGFSLVVYPIDGFPRIDPESYGKYPTVPLNCHPIVARIFFEQEQIGWSRKKLAEKVGIHYNTLNRMANGESRAKVDNVEACLNAMGLRLVPKKFHRRISVPNSVDRTSRGKEA